MPDLQFEQGQVRLRDAVRGDLDRFRYWLQPGRAWQALDGPYYPRPTGDEIDDVVAGIEAEIDSGDRPDPRRRLVIADRSSDDLLGQVSWYWISEETNWAAIGIVLYDPTSWGRGLGFEALGLWSDHLFDRFPEWVRLDLRTWSGNEGMARLAEKLGYRQEARFRNARIVDGRYHDGLGYGVLREEWADRYPAGFAAARRADDGGPVSD